MDNQTTGRQSSDDAQRLAFTRQIDEVCDAYEAATSDGNLPPFAPFLQAASPSIKGSLLRELLEIARERLLAEGETDPAARLLLANPEITKDIEAILSAGPESLTTANYAAPAGGLAASPLTPRRRKSRGLRLRCPHCSNHVELVGDTPLDAVDCTTCGSRFSLVDRSRETSMAESLQQIDRFELVSRLGVGGFGTVWKARDPDLERTVAIKIPRHGQLTPTEIEHFLREARSAAQLTHPNIVPVHEVGRQDDVVFIVSDLIRGVSLSDLMTGKRPTIRESAALCLTIADALEHAHQRGVVHRDLKPSNVMIDDNGAPHLMDFGLAKREAEEVTMTTDGQIIGTPAYMSPEQARGDSAWVDRRTDVYSLGVMLFELLTGELPFRGNAQMQVRQRLNEEAPNARRLNRHLPQDVATICAKCLEREPGRRYQTAGEVREELSRFLQKLPIKARPLSFVQRSVRWAARNPALTGVLSLITLLAVVGPTVAVVIESQRARLASLFVEKNNLIDRKSKQAQESLAESTQLRSRLDVWEGRTNPWELWPPNENRSPQQRQLASLLANREEALAGSLPGQPQTSSDLTEARRHLALALLYTAAKKNELAIRRLNSAIEPLKRLRLRYPRSIAIPTALADCYERLSQLTAATDRATSEKWLETAANLHEQIAEEFPQDVLAQANRLDAEIRVAVSMGFDSAEEELGEIQQRQTELERQWPNAVADLYELTCKLAGVSAPLAKAPESRDSPEAIVPSE